MAIALNAFLFDGIKTHGTVVRTIECKSSDRVGEVWMNYARSQNARSLPLYPSFFKSGRRRSNRTPVTRVHTIHHVDCAAAIRGGDTVGDVMPTPIVHVYVFPEDGASPDLKVKKLRGTVPRGTARWVIPQKWTRSAPGDG